MNRYNALLIILNIRIIWFSWKELLSHSRNKLSFYSCLCFTSILLETLMDQLLGFLILFIWMNLLLTGWCFKLYPQYISIIMSFFSLSMCFWHTHKDLFTSPRLGRLESSCPSIIFLLLERRNLWVTSQSFRVRWSNICTRHLFLKVVLVSL